VPRLSFRPYVSAAQKSLKQPPDIEMGIAAEYLIYGRNGKLWQMQ